MRHPMANGGQSQSLVLPAEVSAAHHICSCLGHWCDMVAQAYNYDYLLCKYRVSALIMKVPQRFKLPAIF